MQGMRNDFKDAMDKLDQEYLDQLAKHEVRGNKGVLFSTTYTVQYMYI